jgi:hypothetical protein
MFGPRWSLCSSRRSPQSASSITMMNLVEELLAPDDVAAYVGVLMDKVKTEKYSSLSMTRRLMAFG